MSRLKKELYRYTFTSRWPASIGEQVSVVTSEDKTICGKVTKVVMKNFDKYEITLATKEPIVEVEHPNKVAYSIRNA